MNKIAVASRMNFDSEFVFSRHGTTFLYPLQIHLIEILRQEMTSGNLFIQFDDLVAKLLQKGYSKKAIISEINRCFYFGTLTQYGVASSGTMRITPFFDILARSYCEEISRQEKEVLIRIYRRGNDNFSLVVRDTSFLSAAMRNWLNHNGFRNVPIYEIRKSRVQIKELERLLSELIDLIADFKEQNGEYSGMNEFEGLFLLVQKFGKYYNSIKDKYVHYALPHEYSWQDSQILRLMLIHIKKLAHGPLEWRGHTFSQVDVYSSLSQDYEKIFHLYNRKDIERCYIYLQEKLFIRSLGLFNGIEKFTIVGQAESWIEEFFRTINENYSTIDASIMYAGQNKYSIRFANNSFLPIMIRSKLEEICTEITDYWIRIENIYSDDLLDLLTDCSMKLTRWKKSSGIIK